jgi:hypothetical protein
VLVGSPLIFVLENSQFGHLKVYFSAPLAPGSLPACSIRVRHMAQRGGLTVSRDGIVGLSEDGMSSLEAGMLNPADRVDCNRIPGSSSRVEETEPTPTSRRPQSPEASLSPITPAKMRTIHSNLGGAAESPSTAIPRIAVPATPMPVQTA